MAKTIVFSKVHNLPETRTTYKKGDPLTVSDDLAKRLESEGVIEKETKKAVAQKEPKADKAK